VRSPAFANPNQDFEQRTQSAVQQFESRRSWSCRYKKAASGVPDAAVANALANGLKGEIYARAGHAEVVFRPINEIPAEITDPADMRRKADFHAAADLPECTRLAASMADRLDNVESFSRLSKSLVNLPLAATKDCAAAAKKVGRKARARDRITQCERAQHSADCITLVVNATLKDVVAEIDEPMDRMKKYFRSMPPPQA